MNRQLYQFSYMDLMPETEQGRHKENTGFRHVTAEKITRSL